MYFFNNFNKSDLHWLDISIVYYIFCLLNYFSINFGLSFYNYLFKIKRISFVLRNRLDIASNCQTLCVSNSVVCVQKNTLVVLRYVCFLRN